MRFPAATGTQDKALQEMAQGLLRLLFEFSQQVSQIGRADKDVGEEVGELEFAGWALFWSTVEHHLGSEEFDAIIGQYLREREKGKRGEDSDGTG